jgi:hypothetical protein
LFIALVFIAIGVFIWTHKSSGVLVTKSAPAAPESAETRPSSGKSRRLPGEMRAILFQHGVTESFVHKSFTEQRAGNAAGGEYLEGTLVVSAPPQFQPALFLMDLGRLLEGENLRLLKNVQDKGRWLLDVGEADRVYQHLEIQFGGSETSIKPAAKRAKK